MPKANKKSQKQKDEDALWADKEAKLASLDLSAAVSENEQPEDEEEEEVEAEPINTQNKKQNAFDLLNAQLAQDDAGQSLDEDDVEEEEDDDAEGETNTVETVTSKPKRPKKKKKKAKAKAANDEEQHGSGMEEDEIDAALKALNETSINNKAPAAPTISKAAVSEASELAALLHIDSKNLDVDNEMRRLFGRAAVTAREDDDDGGGHARNRGNRRGIVPGARGRGLAQGGKRNVFVQGGEGWPAAGSGGLGMEIVNRNDDGTIEFQYVHSKAYQDVERQFMECVKSMDPERMILLMQHNPYHISTLLQVSHIALTQNNPPDHNSSQVLIARALFSMGRSTHSAFPTTLASGLARLSFQHFENRELWFTGWRYIGSLARRGMWRTGLEMIRTLLQLDPTGDPLCMVLCIDQYALKARQPKMLLELASTALLRPVWMELPNIRYSIPLAHLQLGQIEDAERTLKEAIEKFSWLLPKLYKALDNDSIPSVFKNTRSSNEDELLASLYCYRSADAWNIPEATALLLRVANSYTGSSKIPAPSSASPSFVKDHERDIARHVLLTDVPALLSFLPRSVVAEQGMAFDILPPVGAISEYQKNMYNHSGSSATGAFGGPSGQDTGDSGILTTFFRSLLPNFVPQAGGQNAQVVETLQRDFEHLPPAEQEGFLRHMQNEILRHFHGTLPPGEQEGEGQGLINETGSGTERDESSRNVWMEDAPEEEEEEEQEEERHESQAVDRLVQILRSGGTGNLEERLNRMFEGQGEEMAEVRRQVEEKLGVRR